MGLFKKKKPSVKNLLSDRQLKENLLDTALSVLVNQQELSLTKEDFTGIEAEFGYLLMIADHGLEALFKIKKDSAVYYFAAQQGKLMLLSINEAQFQSTVAYMLDYHKVTD